MKSKLLIVIIVSIALVPAISIGQTVIPVTAGTDAISTALAAATAGDTLELTTSGGTYDEAAAAVVDKAVTIRAAAGLAAKPVWTTDDTLTIIMLSSSLTLEGIILNGSLGADSTEFGILVADGTMGYTLEVFDCIFWSFGSSTKRGNGIQGTYEDATGTVWHAEADALIVDNCMFGNIEGEGIDYSYPSDLGREQGACLDYYITNSTFWGKGPSYNEGIYTHTRNDGSGSVGVITSPYFTVDHCTFIAVGGKAIYPKYIDGAVVSNTISVSNEDDALRIYGATSELRNFLWYDCPSGIDYYSSSSGSNTSPGTNVLNVDPLIVDTDYLTTGNFTLAAGSPAVGQDDDGGTLGDPRWWPGGTAEWPAGGTSAIAPDAGTPVSFQLHQNYPNPFNPTTTIGYDLIKSGHVTLTVYNLLGQVVTTLVDQHMGIGHHSVQWGSDESVSGGIYFYRLRTSGNVEIRKMVLLK